MFAFEDSKCSVEFVAESHAHNSRFSTSVTNCISVGHRYAADQYERVVDTDFERFTSFESVLVEQPSELSHWLRCFIMLIVVSEIPWILNELFLRFGIGFLFTGSCGSIEPIEESVKLSEILLRVVATCESRTASTEAQYRRGSEVCGDFVRSPELEQCFSRSTILVIQEH